MHALFSRLRNARPQPGAIPKALLRAWERFGFYLSLALALALIGGAAVAIRNRALPQAAPVVRMAAPSETAAPEPEPSSAPALSLFWPLEGEILTNHAPLSAVYQPGLGLYTAHSGVDIAGSAGAEVYAAADGTVSLIERSPLYGCVMEIAHEDGFVTRYGGLTADARILQGSHVRAGAPIGYLSDSAHGESYL